MRTRYIKVFDPWKNPLCTCPKKYSLNPYTGCPHGCIYCYATYIPKFRTPRRKKNLLSYVERDLDLIEKNSLISISNSSDPYPNFERSFEDTRRTLKLIKEKGNFKVLILTKSDLVKRDIDILKDMKAAVSITITTLSKEKAEKLEPYAPPPASRISALEELKKAEIPTILRLDPIILGLNEDEIEDIIKRCHPFIDHVVSSTLKIRGDIFFQFKRIFPNLFERIKMEYISFGEKIGGYRYLRKSIREDMLGKVSYICKKYGLSFGFCREGVEFLGKSCDGSHLLN